MSETAEPRIIKNISQLATLSKVSQKDGRKLSPDDIGIIDKGAIVFDSQEILWVGEERSLPKKYAGNRRSIDLGGRVLLPEIVDPHTHIVFAGDRSKEYSMRLKGEDYEKIALAGGGILYTMAQTNLASERELKKLAIERIKRIHSYGVGTIEIKSGYGLNAQKEEKISRLIAELKEELAPNIHIVNTYMAAHAVPPHHNSSHNYILEEVVPLMKKLVSEKIIDAVDIFHEEGYFDSIDVEVIFQEAAKLSLPVKIHADEFRDNGGRCWLANIKP